MRANREKNRDVLLAQRRAHYQNNKYKILTKQREWSKANKGKMQAWLKEYNAKEEVKKRTALSQAAYRKRHPERFQTSKFKEARKRTVAKFKKSPKGKICAIHSAHRRRAAKMNTEYPATAKQLAELKAKAKGICYYCGKKVKKLTFDHINPLGLSGPHSIDNLVMACLPCNLSKNDTPPEVYARRIGLLLI